MMWIDMGKVVFKYAEAAKAQIICGDAICNTLAVDADNQKYLAALMGRAAELFPDNDNTEIDGIELMFADGRDSTCAASSPWWSQCRNWEYKAACGWYPGDSG